ncbi:MAG: OmpA family protein [Fibromonadales bacterium]|nr:OmpA family protein [Fibromonadales bacterium]
MVVVETMQTYPEVTFRVVGHTDDQGKRETNQKLSEARAKAVADFLISRGISASRLDFEGRGPDQPVASNKTAAGRAKNRRIEFQRTDN